MAPGLWFEKTSFTGPTRGPNASKPARRRKAARVGTYSPKSCSDATSCHLAGPLAIRLSCLGDKRSPVQIRAPDSKKAPKTGAFCFGHW
jgi:hypothetical protein